MSRGRMRRAGLACAALALLAVACEQQPAEDQEDQDPIEEDEGPEPEDAEDAEGDVGGGTHAGADEAREPIEGRTIIDVLDERSRGAEDEAPEPGAPEVAEQDEEAGEEPEPTYLSVLDVVQAVQLEERLRSEGPFTVFAPTDEAFAFLPQDTYEGLLEEPDRLQAVVAYHVVEDELFAEDLTMGETLEAVSGHELRVSTTESGELTVGGARLVDEDLDAGNGVVHGIGAVLLPPQE